MTSALLPTYARAPIAFERGEGAWLVARDGERYLDFGAGIAVNALGHAHPHLVDALTSQAQKLWHTSNLFEIPDGERLGQRLVDATFADVAFFANSGAEANEAAIKMARKYHAVGGHPERFRIITFEGAFHGRTLATIAAGGQAKYIEGFGPKVDGFDQVPTGDFDALEAAIGPETAALMIEPIQGEGGVRVIPHEHLRALRALCDAHGLLLIMDEVQTGVGRTGRLFAHEWSGVTPDIMSAAKGIGGGFPLGVCLATAEAARGMTAGTHGTTFGGNPLAMAVGNAVLDVVLADGFLDRVGQVGLLLKQRLAALQDRHPTVIREIRGDGLMLGLKLGVLNTDFAAAARDMHLLVIPAGDNVVRLLPPLIITDADVAEAVSRLDATATALETRTQGAAA
ncbi:MAG: aspartate aminotransferase family protein [Methylobacterium sp.]|uniref:aspartate aminotransferase family protein n=1 Tax=Methylobacterium sp. TaxID=409 RepID=UPI00271FA8D1|nr:aspartate aminotransferase family protein [Methylobacterium sp.]MDO9425609.1 aspartate aminotransferase family protein [Methylobacterium sp.]